GEAASGGVWLGRGGGAGFRSRFRGGPAMSARLLTLRRRKRRLRGFCLRGTRAPTFSRGLAAAPPCRRGLLRSGVASDASGVLFAREEGRRLSAGGFSGAAAAP